MHRWRPLPRTVILGTLSRNELPPSALIIAGSSSLYCSGGRRMYLSSEMAPPRSCRGGGHSVAAATVHMHILLLILLPVSSGKDSAESSLPEQGRTLAWRLTAWRDPLGGCAWAAAAAAAAAQPALPPLQRQGAAAPCSCCWGGAARLHGCQDASAGLLPAHRAGWRRRRRAAAAIAGRRPTLHSPHRGPQNWPAARLGPSRTPHYEFSLTEERHCVRVFHNHAQVPFLLPHDAMQCGWA